MLEYIILMIHRLKPNIVNPYTLQTNKDSIVINFNDLLENSISIRIVFRDYRLSYSIMNEKSEFKMISKSTLKVMMRTLIERPSFDNLLESIGIKNV